jgi:hypothetical protein
MPPGHTRPAGPYDTDARWAAKGAGLFWLGCKLHLTETCDEPAENTEHTERTAPNLITNVHATNATVPDNAATIPIHQNLSDRGPAPDRHYLDSGYPSVPNMLAARREHGIMMITPLLGDSSRQTKTGNGSSRDKFTIDYDSRTATWNHGVHDGIEKIYITFPQRACQACDAQPKCTTSKTRQRGLTVCPRELHEIQQAARVPPRARTAQSTNSPEHEQPRARTADGPTTGAAPASKAP